MQIAKGKKELRNAIKSFTHKEKIVFVPTMGALHVGHYTLIDEARKMAGEEGMVIVSLFINPIQFNNQGDLQSYPQSFEHDKLGCEQHGVDLLFAPSPEEMYANDRSIDIVENTLSSRLCGASRPGHFSGVCTVVSKLFHLVTPTDALFGEKDYQQLAIIRRMVRDLDFDINIHGIPTVRQEDGLACSSRNERLTPEQREEATILYKALSAAGEAWKQGESSPAKLIALATDMIKKSPSSPQIDYLELFDGETLEPREQANQKSVMALAAFFGDVRLIDNLSFSSLCS